MKFFSLNDPNDLTAGIRPKIAEIHQDPYMYTDFTGATLYLNNSLNEYDFSSLGFWKDDETLKQISVVGREVKEPNGQTLRRAAVI